MEDATGGSRRPSRVLPALCCWVLFALAVAGAWSLVTPPPSAEAGQDTATRADGEHLWSRDCASCHGPEGQGTDAGPSLEGQGAAGVSLALTTGRMPLDDHVVVEDSRDFQAPRGPVAYTPAQIDAIVQHASTILDGPDVPEVDTGAADLSHGEELFRTNCAACHTWSGRGGALTSGRIAPSLAESTPTEVVAAMRVGMGTMPQFDEGTLDDEQAAAVAAYVEELHDPPSPGGYGLAYLGPFAEGFVAWMLGIVLLLLAVRWIGSRT